MQPESSEAESSAASAKADRLAAVLGGSQILCCKCLELKEPDAFSKKQLSQLAISTLRGRGKQDIMCRTCTDNQHFGPLPKASLREKAQQQPPVSATELEDAINTAATLMAAIATAKKMKAPRNPTAALQWLNSVSGVFCTKHGELWAFIKVQLGMGWSGTSCNPTGRRSSTKSQVPTSPYLLGARRDTAKRHRRRFRAWLLLKASALSAVKSLRYK